MSQFHSSYKWKVRPLAPVEYSAHDLDEPDFDFPSYMRDWSTAVRRSPQYRVNKPWFTASDCSARNCLRIMSFLTVALCGIILVLVYSNHRYRTAYQDDCHAVSGKGGSVYNDTYPLTPIAHTAQGTAFRIAVITDLDHASKSETEKNTWFSYLRYGQLVLSQDQTRVKVTWDDKTHAIKSSVSAGGRSMELSDLKVFNGRLA